MRAKDDASKATMQDIPVVVVGGGAIGLAVALGLAQAGVPVVLAGAAETVHDDGRTAALMQPSIATFGRLGVLERLKEKSWPLAAIRLVDITGALVRSPTVTFRASEIGHDYFALNFSNADIVREMTAALRAEPNATVLTARVTDVGIGPEAVALTLSDGQSLRCALAVAADGQKSPLREAAGIGTRRWPYDQVALTFHVTHPKDHEDISTEFHTRAGPLTYVPYGPFKSSVVWLVTHAEAKRLMALPPQEVARACQRMSSSLLGDLTIVGGVGAVPMGAMIARTAAANRIALAGEALHAFPPVGAQGMNLGLRDADNLLDAIIPALRRGEDPGSAAALAPYERGRQVDAVSRTYGVDMLNRSLISGLLPVDLARFAGLTAAATFGPLRRALMRAGMGQSPFAA